MTTKEKLYSEWMSINEQIEEVNPRFIAAERAMPRTEVMRYPVNEWHRRIENAKNSLERAIKEKRIADYWATEEGQARKKALEDEKSRLYDELEDWFKAGEDGIKEMVNEHIGEGFDIHFGGSKIEFGLVERYTEERRPCFYFGHTWDLYYGYDYMAQFFRFEMGHGSCGSFTLIKDAKRTKFIAGMCKFATDIAFLEQLKEELQYFDEEVRKRQKRIREIGKEIENPFSNK